MGKASFTHLHYSNFLPPTLGEICYILVTDDTLVIYKLYNDISHMQNMQVSHSCHYRAVSLPKACPSVANEKAGNG